MSEFTGEQKLRIVLESILRNVPKSEQCQKYGITEAEFDSWNHKLVTDGGRIYDEYKPATSVERTPMLTNLKSLGKVGIILSILINLGALCFLGVWLLTDDDVETATAPLTEVEIVEDIPEAYTELESPIVGGGNLPESG
jgi:transposase-like protein